jgi:hypothetical protein
MAKPGEAVLRVRARADNRRGCRLSGDGLVLRTVEHVHDKSAELMNVPRVEADKIGDDLLLDAATRNESHGRRRSGAGRGESGVPELIGWWRVGETAGLRVVHTNLHAAMSFHAGDLALNGNATPQRHCNELPDVSAAGVDAVEPELRRTHDIVLRGGAKGIGPFTARYRVHSTHGDGDRAGLPRSGIERQPQRLCLVHADEHAVVLQPPSRYPVAIVFDAEHLKSS